MESSYTLLFINSISELANLPPWRWLGSRSLQNLGNTISKYILCGRDLNCLFNLHGPCDILFCIVSFWQINDYEKSCLKIKVLVYEGWHEGESKVKAETIRHGLKSYLDASFACLNIAGSLKVLWECVWLSRHNVNVCTAGQ